MADEVKTALLLIVCVNWFCYAAFFAYQPCVCFRQDRSFTFYIDYVLADVTIFCEVTKRGSVSHVSSSSAMCFIVPTTNSQRHIITFLTFNNLI